MNGSLTLPPELVPTHDAALQAIAPIRPVGHETLADPNFLFTAQRTKAGRNLPPYYLVYFLLVDLLGFKNLGKFEKIAWSVPIDFNGRAFLIEHRKMGVGVFAHDTKAEENASRQIVILIQKGVKAAQPFFEWLAGQAVRTSAVNVVNMSATLFDRFTYLFEEYRSKAKEALDRKDERHVEKRDVTGGTMTIVDTPVWKLRTESGWLALAAIDAFFSWTEHVFIHVAILSGNIKTASEIADLAEADWPAKFKHALDVTEPITKTMFDKLLVIRRQIRNFITHGAFGKQGEAFRFHSGAGAVPVLLPHLAGSRRFVLGDELVFDDDAALSLIEEFIAHLWSGPRRPAEIYIQRSGLPLILTMVADGTYARAMTSTDEMTEFIDYLTRKFDDASNVDW